MKVILTTNIKKIGKVGDQVNVKDGFARNYLFPNKMGLRNTKNNLEHFDKIKDEINNKENKKEQEALELIVSIKKIKIEFTREADDKDQLYGAISKKDIINYYSDKDIKILSDDLKIPQSIRTLGEHVVHLNPYDGVNTDIKILIKKS